MRLPSPSSALLLLLLFTDLQTADSLRLENAKELTRSAAPDFDRKLKWKLRSGSGEV
jgi:hypothetical protein